MPDIGIVICDTPSAGNDTVVHAARHVLVRQPPLAV